MPRPHRIPTRLPRPVLLTAAATALGLTAGAAPALAAQGATAARGARSTVAGLKKARWGANVTITYGNGTIRYRSNGIPNHSRQTEYALPNTGVVVPSAATAHAGTDPTKAQTYDDTITTRPKKAAKTTSASLGTIGVMISGAALFNPYEGDGSTVAVQSNFTVTGSDGSAVAFLDACNGHPTPMGQYHYHALPTCVTAKVDRAKGPSHLIGIAFDGFPIYGDRDSRGRKVSAAKLDRCNGITSPTPEFPKGIYHYVLLNTKDSTSSIRCFRGTVDSSLTSMAGMPGMGGGPPRATTAASTRSLYCDLAHPRSA